MTIDFNFKIWNWGKLFQPEYPITCTCQKPNYPTTTNLVDDNMFPPNESFKICVISQLVRMKLQMLCVLWISGKELDNPYFRNLTKFSGLWNWSVSRSNCASLIKLWKWIRIHVFIVQALCEIGEESWYKLLETVYACILTYSCKISLNTDCSPACYDFSRKFMCINTGFELMVYWILIWQLISRWLTFLAF